MSAVSHRRRWSIGAERPGVSWGVAPGDRGVTRMIPMAPGARVWLASGHTDMRNGMRGLALQVQEGVGRDPLDLQ